MRRVCMAALMALGMSLVWTVRVQAQGFTVARDEATGKYGYKANGRNLDHRSGVRPCRGVLGKYGRGT